MTKQKKTKHRKKKGVQPKRRKAWNILSGLTREFREDVRY